MPRWKLPQVTICLASACAVLLACSAPQPTAKPHAAATAHPSISHTEVITFVPAVPTQEREGSCWTNSFSVPRADAWRCTVDNQILDPCYTADDGETIVCGVFPGTDNPGFKLNLTTPLPTPTVPPGAPAVAFMIQLVDGTLCHFASGATLAFGEKRLNFNCVGGSPSAQIVILGELQAGTVWWAEKAIMARNAGGFTIQSTEMVEIRTVWQ